MPHIIVGTAGHIDHGKTALVKALTGIDADRLKEEKERGITIDLGFANLSLDSNTTLGFVDVPGHERFVKNMLAGAGGIDMVLLVIAADESVMPQTREHLDICSLLHVKQGLTVLTKIDKVETEMVDLVEAEVRDFLKGSFLENSPILRVSSHTSEGIPRLIETLRSYAAKIQPKDSSEIFRLPIDRCFTMKGFGTVITGTLVAGRIRKDEEVEILPSQRPARVRGIQVHGDAANEAVAGQRTALNLQGVDVSDIHRGMVLTIPGIFKPGSIFHCNLELLPSVQKRIEKRKRIRFHIGTAELMGYVVPFQAGPVEIRLEQPTFALPGDRFIIRQYSPMITIGGGEIRKPTVLELVEEAGLQTVELRQLVSRLGMMPERIREEIGALAKSGAIHVLSENPLTLVSMRDFDDVSGRTVSEIREFHRTKPLVQGIGREELRAKIFAQAPNLLFQAVLDRLIAARKIAATHDIVHEFDRKVTLKTGEERMREQLRERFRSLGLQVPAPDDVIDGLKLDRSTAQKIIQLMVKDNTLVKVSENMLVDRATIDKLIADVKAVKSKNARLGVGEFKDLTGVSRKYAIPLLEYLDRQRVTRRVGDERMIL